jgi:nucleoside-diphosphate-sugar epimerase
VNELLIDGWHVIALHRASSKISRLKGLDITTRECDLHDPASVQAAVPDGADAIFHVAANTSHWRLEAAEQWRDNVLATRNLVATAISKHVGRFVYTSTGATFPYRHLHSVEEAMRIPNQYVRTKRLSELEVGSGMDAGLDAVFTQPAIVVGPYDYNSYSQIFTSLQAGTMPGVLPGSIEFCHARDVARAHVTAFERGRRGESYVLGGPYASWLEVCQKIARLVGAKPPRWQTPLWVLYAIAYPAEWGSYWTRRRPLLTPQLVHLLKPGGRTPPEVARKSRDELGYVSPSIDTMLRDCYEWLVQEGLLERTE